MVNYSNISVVIPNIGEKSLLQVINKLNLGVLKPKEIILVTPKLYLCNLNDIKFDKNVKILDCSVASQVEQRIIGFKNSKYDLVMQLDADIIFENETLLNLVNCIKKYKNSVAVGPHYKKSIKSNSNFLKNFLFKFFINREKKRIVWDSWFFNDYKNNDNDEFSTRWLPGGCIIYRKNNLILNSYYPYHGKAFDEDLLHSVILRNKGVNLIHCGKAHCYSLEDTYEHKEFRVLLKYMLRVFAVKNKVRRLGNGNLIIFCTWYVYWIINEMIRYLKNYLR